MADIVYDCCLGYLVVSILIWLFSGYAYLVNRGYAPGDPARRDYDPLAVFLAPFTWPFLAFGGFVVTILKAVLFGIFLLLFSIAAAVIRKPFFWRWLEPIVLKVGRRTLKANTFLIRLFTRDT